MATFVAALPMAILGTTFAAAQLGWRGPGRHRRAAGLGGRPRGGADQRPGSPARVGASRSRAACWPRCSGPFLVAAAGPDSTTPFLVFGMLAALLMPRALRIGTRQAAWRASCRVWLWAWRSVSPTSRARRRSGWVSRTWCCSPSACDRCRRAPGCGPSVTLLGAGRGRWPAVVVPWLIRDALAFGSPFPGRRSTTRCCAATRTSSRGRPADPGRLPGPGRPAASWANQARGRGPRPAERADRAGLPGGTRSGLVALVALRRSPALRRPTALQALLLSGALTFLATALLFPVATLWGTFLHASGPLLVGLAVWPRSAVTRWWRASPERGLGAPQRDRGAHRAARGDRAAGRAPGGHRGPPDVRGARPHPAIAAELDGTPASTARHCGSACGRRRAARRVHQRPSDVAGRCAGAAGDRAARRAARRRRATWPTDFGASYLVVFDEHGRYPDALLPTAAAALLRRRAVRLGDATDPAWLFRLESGCGS